MKLIVLFLLITSNYFLIAEELRHKNRGKNKKKSKAGFNVVHKECKKKHMVALTFDDGVV